MLLSIIFFFVVALGLGFSIDLFIKKWQADWLEKIVIRFGVGLASISVIGIILGYFGLIDWKIFLALAVVIVSLNFILKRRRIKKYFKDKTSLNFLKITKKQIYSILLIIMFIITAYMYIQGSFNDPSFEDSDGWEYAYTSKYIAESRTFLNKFYFDHFAYPYTQGYQIIMGTIHQTNDSIYWTMKFFHNLVLAFSIFFFFFFIKRFSKNLDIAFFSTFFLFAIISWFSRFIFSLSFNMTLTLVFFYAVVLTKQNKLWKYPAIVVFASLLVNHLNTGVVAVALFFIYYLTRVFVEEKFNKDTLQIGIFGPLLAGIIYWIPAIFLFRYMLFTETPDQIGGLGDLAPVISTILFNKIILILTIILVIALIVLYFKRKVWFPYIQKILRKKYVKLIVFGIIILITLLVLVVPSDKLVYKKGSGTKAYTLGDFFSSSSANLINNPLGVGPILMIVFLFGTAILLINIKKMFYRPSPFVSTVFLWLLFNFILVMGEYHSIEFVPFRMMTYFAMTVALVSGIALSTAISIPKNKIIKIGIVLVIFALVFFTSFVPKYQLNTMPWPEHMIMVPEALGLYEDLRDSGDVPKWTRINSLCHAPFIAVSFDMMSDGWNSEEITNYHKQFLNDSVEENYLFLKNYDYQYAVVDVSCVTKFNRDPNQVDEKLVKFINSTEKFRLVKKTNGAFLFEVL